MAAALKADRSYGEQSARESTLELRNAAKPDIPSIVPITDFAHKLRVVGDAHIGAIVASLDMAAERFGATNLYRRHDTALGEIQMPLIGRAPTGSVAAEHIRHLEIRRGHRRFVRSTKSSPYSGVRAGFEPVEKTSRRRRLRDVALIETAAGHWRDARFFVRQIDLIVRPRSFTP